MRNLPGAQAWNVNNKEFGMVKSPSAIEMLGSFRSELKLSSVQKPFGIERLVNRLIIGKLITWSGLLNLHTSVVVVKSVRNTDSESLLIF